MLQAIQIPKFTLCSLTSYVGVQICIFMMSLLVSASVILPAFSFLDYRSPIVIRSWMTWYLMPHSSRLLAALAVDSSQVVDYVVVMDEHSMGFAARLVDPLVDLVAGLDVLLPAHLGRLP